MSPQQFGEHALVMWIQVLHQHECHAGIRWHVREECPEGLEPTR
jgi:hypothetical protein